MFSFSSIKDSTIWTLILFWRFLYSFWFGIISLSDWMRGFALVDKWFFTFFLSKVAIVVVGIIMTPLPVWVLALLSFLPPPVIVPIFFIAFIVMFKQ